MSTEALIREVEADVLDRAHRDNPIFRLPEESATRRVIKVFGDVIRDMAGRWSASELDLWVKSLTHCVKWIHQLCHSETFEEEPLWKAQDAYAADLLVWGCSYVRLFSDHVAWSRGYISAEGDRRSKTIIFSYANLLPGFVVEQQSRDESELMDDMAEAESGIDAIFHRWHPNVRCSEAEGLQYPPELIPNMSELSLVKEWCSGIILPELPDSTCIGSYRLGDLRQFYACVYALCACVARLEDIEDQKHGDEHWMGSWVECQPFGELVEWFCRSSGLSSTVVQAMVKDLTIDTNRTHCSLKATPLIPTRCGKIIFSPRLFSMAHPQRTILSALTIGSARKSYDDISEGVEQWWIRHIGSFLADRTNCAIIQKPALRFAAGLQTPDLLAVDLRGRQLYVIEFKNHAAPLDVRSVCNRIEDFKKGTAQLKGYVEKARSFLSVVGRDIGQPVDGFSVRGLLLFRHPMPLPVCPDADIIVADWRTIKNLLEAESTEGFSGVLRLLNPAYYDTAQFGEDVIRVGRWKYCRIVPYRQQS